MFVLIFVLKQNPSQSMSNGNFINSFERFVKKANSRKLYMIEKQTANCHIQQVGWFIDFSLIKDVFFLWPEMKSM